MDFIFSFDTSALIALLQVVMIDIMLAGDNAIVIGLAAAAVPPEQRRQVIFWGMTAAVILRIVFTAATSYLLGIVGLTFAGGLLLAWVCWKFWRELRDQGRKDEAHSLAVKATAAGAIWTIMVADVSMSLDNVLAVAGAAGHHFEVMVFGLLLSVALMGTAATFVAKLLSRYPLISYGGLGVIVYVAVDMLFRGFVELDQHFGIVRAITET